MVYRHRGGVWVVEDSGNRNELFAVGPQGEALGRVALRGVANVDMEELAAFHLAGVGRVLVVADTGDNLARRRDTKLVFVAEDAVEQGIRTGWAAPLRSLALRLPSGPADVEALAVHPVDGQLYLLTKREEPPILWRVDMLTGATTRLGPFHWPSDLAEPSQPTAMDFTPDGERLIIQTYTGAWVVGWGAQDWLDGDHLVPFPTPPLEQAEAGCVGPDGDWWLTSEGVGAPLLRLDLPSAAGQ